MNVEVAATAVAPSPPPPTSYGAKLEVLPADMPAPKASAPPARRGTPWLAIGPRPAPEAQAPPPREVAQGPLAIDAGATAPAPASFDCADAPTLAREMVCMDSGLAALDQSMKRAYAQAVSAGVPERYLGEDQQDWLDVREEAARVSRRSVVNIYRQRIDELHILADRDWD